MSRQDIPLAGLQTDVDSCLFDFLDEILRKKALVFFREILKRRRAKTETLYLLTISCIPCLSALDSMRRIQVAQWTRRAGLRWR